MPLSTTNQFVKFVRGTNAAFANLANKNADTLYFISEQNATTGSLYLGSKLISGSTSISELEDFLVENLQDGHILVYDSEQGKWINADPHSVIGIMSGASASNNGTSGLVPAPVVGDQNKFLRGDGIWAEPVATVEFDSLQFENSVEGLSLKGFSDASAGDVLIVGENGIAFAPIGDITADLESRMSVVESFMNNFSGGLEYQTVDSLEDIDLEAEDASKYIYLVRNDNESGNLYDEYIVVDGSLELIGNGFNADLSGYATVEALNLVDGRLTTAEGDISVLQANVGDLSQLIFTADTEEDPSLVLQVNDLTDRLTWKELQNPEE